jgi:hypothetical protein
MALSGGASQVEQAGQWYLRFAEYLAVRFSHADSDNDAIQNHGLRSQAPAAALSSTAATMPSPSPSCRAIISSIRFKGPHCPCCIEPENNVEMILSAFAELPGHPLCWWGN